MARTNKVGIDYFPFDVDFFEDDKIQLIESEFGMKGGYIAIRLLCKIYKGGYYYKWGTDECLLFTRQLGLEGVSKNTVDEIINGLIRRCFFDKRCFDKFGILTSKGIQDRYFEATKRYKKYDVFKEYLLSDNINGENVNIISINADINTTKEKEKKKEKESKLKGYDNFSLDFVADEFKESFIQWLDYKKQRKESYKTQKSLEVCYKQLLAKSENDPLTAMKMVEQSMGNNWAGLFELKSNMSGNNIPRTAAEQTAMQIAHEISLRHGG